MPHAERDAATGRGGPDGPDDAPTGGRSPWILVAIAGALSFTALLDMNVVNIALATIATDLDVSASMAQWAALGYQLAVVSLLLPAGRWLDGGRGNGGVGLRAALLLAVSGFSVCGVLAALAPWMAWLAVARIAQGAFGALLFVLMPVLVVRAVPPSMRGRAMSVPATLGPLGAVTGPAVGGVLLDAFGWRAVLLVKLPVCLAALVVVARVLPRRGGLVAPDRRSLADAALVGGAVAALLLALTLAPGAPVWLLLGLAAVPPLVWWTRRPAARPVLDVVRASGVAGVYGAVFSLAAGFAAMHYVVALRLQTGSGLSATATGLTVLAFPLAMGVMGPLGGRLADRYGARSTAIAGACVTALGLTLLALNGDHWTQADITWRLALAGAGMGLYGGPTQTLVMTAAPRRATGVAGSLVQLSRSLGFTVGPALAGAAWGLAGGADGARYGLVISAVAAWLCVLLLTTGRRAPSGEPAPAAEPVAR
ncbi:MFS transporter [Streptomyces somaliensis DSM 40738]|uniref:MFS transporter n=1 Tax=Streptomyces somaliensis (strain ATCC 33201 / DSM 40738 / JCM 12659 / KCTC 9044 / NCTC 11332 / NRRL B-12077 / IP 733) TaxID=1134445 RepID=A0AA44DDJ8_STRE0|nr:MFS transporter [Streptomyces somaliensis]MCQ0023170.1 MFS transporter [Streptomyces somaliensis DSM 40738]NKY14777.1 MFS transporter [Streptomyces somaliensis DSM 40738]